MNRIDTAIDEQIQLVDYLRFSLYKKARWDEPDTPPSHFAGTFPEWMTLEARLEADNAASAEATMRQLDSWYVGRGANL